MSSDIALIAQFEKAQAAKYDELYDTTLRNSTVQIQKIKHLSGECAELLALQAQEVELRPKFDILRAAIHQRMYLPSTIENWKYIRKIHNNRVYRNCFTMRLKIFEIEYGLTQPDQVRLRNTLIENILNKTDGLDTEEQREAEKARIEADWISIIPKEAKKLCAEKKITIESREETIIRSFSPGNIKTLAADYRSDQSAKNTAAYANAIRGLQVDCSICCDPDEFFKPKITSNCHHTFHAQCIRNWLAVNNSCPICRSDNPFYEI